VPELILQLVLPGITVQAFSSEKEGSGVPPVRVEVLKDWRNPTLEELK